RVNTFTANALFNTWISDLHTCLKLLPLPLFRDLPLSENGFGLDTELTAMMLARGVRPYEVPITYKARSREEGKKLTWGDGVVATRILIRVRLRKALTDPRAGRRQPMSPLNRRRACFRAAAPAGGGGRCSPGGRQRESGAPRHAVAVAEADPDEEAGRIVSAPPQDRPADLHPADLGDDATA